MIMRAETQHDGWWSAEDLLKKVNERAIYIFQAQFPGKQALFGFDNATGHCAFVPNALHANRINLGSGSKFPLMRSTIRGEENFKP